MIDPNKVRTFANIGKKVFEKSVKSGLISFLNANLCDRLLQFDHENLVKVYSYEKMEDGSYAFNLAYCEFESLAEIINSRNRCRICEQSDIGNFERTCVYPWARICSWGSQAFQYFGCQE